MVDIAGLNLKLFESVGTLLGPEGKIIEIIPDALQPSALIVVVLLLCVWWLYRNYKTQEPLFQPLVFILVLSTFITPFSPGTLRFLIGFALVAQGVSIIQRMREGGDPKKIIGYIVVMWLVSFLLLGSVFTIPLAIGFTLVILAFKRHIKLSSEEKRQIAEAGYSARPERKIEGREKGFQHIKGKTKAEREAASTKREEAIEMQRQVELEEHELAISASIRVIAMHVSDLEKQEFDMDKKEQGISDYLLQIARRLDSMTKQKYDGDYDIDNRLRKPLFELVERLNRALQEMFRVESDRIKTRNKIGKSLDDSVEALKNAGKSSEDIVGLFYKHEKKLKKAIDKQIKDFEKKLSEDQKHQAENIKAEFDNILKYLKRKILIALQNDLGAFAKKIAMIETAEKGESARIYEKMENLLEQLKKAEANLESTFKKFKTDEISEDIARKATTSIQEFFELFIQLSDQSVAYMENLNAFIKESAQLVGGAWSVTKSLAYLNKFFFRLSQMINGLEKMEAASASGEVKAFFEQLESAEDLQEKIDIRSYKKAKVIRVDIAKAYKNLGNAMQEIDSNLSKVKTENGILKRLETTVLNSFDEIVFLIKYIKDTSKKAFTEGVAAVESAEAKESKIKKKAKREARKAFL